MERLPKGTCIVNAYCQFSQQACTNFMQTYLYSLISTHLFILTTNLHGLILQFYLIYRLICQKPAHSFSAQMALVGTFFQMFIVFRMYNFVCKVKILVSFGNNLLSTHQTVMIFQDQSLWPEILNSILKTGSDKTIY